MFVQRALAAARSLSVLTAKRCISQTPPLRQAINNHAPNALEKRFLVWTGKFKSIGEVPNMVNQDVMERCRNKMRIRIANIMMLLTVIGSCIAVYSGKQAAKRGETVSKQNLDWHEEYNKRYAKNEGKE